MKNTDSLDRTVLRWHGILGHAYVVLTNVGARLETSSRQGAIDAALGEYKDENPRVWNQYKAGKWKRVPLPTEVR